MSKRYQVIIVGGGPVGVGLAIDLAQRGVSCALIERRVGMHNIPKGQNLTQRTLEHFYFWGCVDEVRAQRLLPPEVPAAGIVAYQSLMSDHWHDFRAAKSSTTITSRRTIACHSIVSKPSCAGGWQACHWSFGWAAQDVAQDETSVRVRVVHEAGNGADNSWRPITL